MPQMYPINWLIMYFYFMLLFIMVMIINYFFSNLTPKKNKKISLIKMKKLDWKW